MGGLVDTDRIVAEASRHQCVLACAATNVEHPAADLSAFGQREERGLRTIDVPRRLGGVEVVGPGGRVARVRRVLRNEHRRTPVSARTSNLSRHRVYGQEAMY